MCVGEERVEGGVTECREENCAWRWKSPIRTEGKQCALEEVLLLMEEYGKRGRGVVDMGVLVS